MRFSLEDARAVLSRTPATLRALCSGVGDAWTEPDYGPGTWSVREIIAHLVFNERTDWIPRLKIVLVHGESRPFDPFDRAGHKDMLGTHTLGRLLDVFEEERAQSLAALDGLKLTAADLERRGAHPALGPVTVANLLAAWVVHDLNHVAQACKAMAYQYKGEVGPWEQYLSILAEPRPR